MARKYTESMQVKLEDKLRSMKNRTYLFNTMTVKILSWKYDGEYCQIATTGSWPVQPIAEMLKYLDDNFLEAEEEDGTPSEQALATTEALEAIPMPKIKGLQKMDDLVDMLFQNIEKVTSNKEFVDQAKAVSGLTNNVVGVVKVQLEALRFATDLHRNR